MEVASGHVFQNQSYPTKGIENADGSFSKYDFQISFKKVIYFLKVVIYIICL